MLLRIFNLSVLATLLLGCGTPPTTPPEPTPSTSDDTLPPGWQGILRVGTMTWQEGSLSMLRTAGAAPLQGAILNALTRDTPDLRAQAVNPDINVFLALDINGQAPTFDLQGTVSGPSGHSTLTYPKGQRWTAEFFHPFQGSGTYTLALNGNAQTARLSATLDASQKLPATVFRKAVITPHSLDLAWSAVAGARSYTVLVYDTTTEKLVYGSTLPGEQTARRAMWAEGPLTSNRRYLVAVIASNLDLTADDAQPYPAALPAQINASATTYEVYSSADPQLSGIAPNAIRTTALVGQDTTRTLELHHTGPLMASATVTEGSAWLNVQERARPSGYGPLLFDVTAICPTGETVLEGRVQVRTNDPQHFTNDLPVLLECAAPMTLTSAWINERFDTGFQHSGNPGGIAWHPNGSAFARVNGDSTITIRDAGTMRPTQVLKVPHTDLQRPSWSPDGRALAVIGQDTLGRAVLFTWDLASSTQRGVANTRWNIPVGAIWNGASDRVLTTGTPYNSVKGVVQVFDERAQEVWSSVLPGFARGAVWSPDFTRVAVLSGGELLVLRASDGQTLTSFPVSSDANDSLAWTGPEEVAASGPQAVYRWDLNTGTERRIAIPLTPDAVSFTLPTLFLPDGRLLLYTGGWAWQRLGRLEVRDGTSGALLQSVDPGLHGFQTWALGPNGDVLIDLTGKIPTTTQKACGAGVSRWTFTPQLTLQGEARAHTCTLTGFALNADRLYSLDSGGGVHTWDATSGVRTSTLDLWRQMDTLVTGAVISPDGARYATVDEQAQVRVHDASGQVTATFKPGNRSDSRSLSWSADGQHLLYTSSSDYTVSVWTAGGRRVWQRTYAAWPLSARWAGDGRIIVNNDGTYERLDGATGAVLSSASDRREDVLAVSCDGRTAVVGDLREVRLLDTGTWKELGRFTYTNGQITAVTMNANCTRFAVATTTQGQGGNLNAVSIHSLRTGDQIGPDLRVNAAQVTTLQWADSRLAIGDFRGRVEVFEVR